MFFYFLIPGFSQSGGLSILTRDHHKTNLRGLSLYRSDRGEALAIWVSGSQGLIGKSKDGGQTWNWYHPKGYATRDFRDIQALDAQTAIAIAVDTPAVILKTTDGGKSWKTVYYNPAKGMFLDALDFSDPGNGIVVGDPVNHVDPLDHVSPEDRQIFLLKTRDGGDHWFPYQLPAESEKADSAEAFFAASGTNIHLNVNGSFLFVSGGSRSRLWTNHGLIGDLPLMQGRATTGANGLAVYGKMVAVVGGDFTRPEAGDSSFALSRNGGKTWVNGPESGAFKGPGYMSSVAIVSEQVLITCGLKGVWLTKDSGLSWQVLDKRPFNTIQLDRKRQTAYLIGPGGTVATYAYKE